MSKKLIQKKSEKNKSIFGTHNNLAKPQYKNRTSFKIDPYIFLADKTPEWKKLFKLKHEAKIVFNKNFTFDIVSSSYTQITGEVRCVNKDYKKK